MVSSSQVVAWQETVKQCFFPIITLYLSLAVMMAISCPYAILRGTLMNGTTFVAIFFAYYVMGIYSYLGQTFTNKVSLQAESRQAGRQADRQAGRWAGRCYSFFFLYKIKKMCVFGKHLH